MRLVGAPPAKSSKRIWSIINRFRRPGGRKQRWRRTALTCVVAIATVIVGAAFLPKVTGPGNVITTSAADLRVVDGDTVSFRGISYRLVGFDAPETNSRAKCDSERASGVRATARFQDLISSGDIVLREVRCSCAPGTEGTHFCNFGRQCGILLRNGENVGDTLIREGLAHPFHCGEFRCPRRLGWC